MNPELKFGRVLAADDPALIGSAAFYLLDYPENYPLYGELMAAAQQAALSTAEQAVPVTNNAELGTLASVWQDVSIALAQAVAEANREQTTNGATAPGQHAAIDILMAQQEALLRVAGRHSTLLEAHDDITAILERRYASRQRTLETQGLEHWKRNCWLDEVRIMADEGLVVRLAQEMRYTEQP